MEPTNRYIAWLEHEYEMLSDYDLDEDDNLIEDRSIRIQNVETSRLEEWNMIGILSQKDKMELRRRKIRKLNEH